MRALDVGHCPGVQIEPLLAKDGVPSPADKLVDHYQGPNREMVDFRVHNSSPIIKAPGARLQGDSSADRAPSHPSTCSFSCAVCVAPKALSHCQPGAIRP